MLGIAIAHALTCGLTLGFAAEAFAADDPITELDTIVVTAPAADGTVRTVPHSVSVITAADIERSTATSVADVLSREANVNLQSFFGNGRNNSVDIRGMGATASSNVLVLVDGVPLNEVDLSGADLSSVPLAQVERIEILRGGGAVRHGNGAVGGVINIITRRALPGESSVGVLGGLGSYNTRQLQASASGGLEQVAASVNYSRLDTDGYRQNGYLNARDVATEVRFFPSGTFNFIDGYFRFAQHRDDSGLPGPVSAAAFASGSAARRASSSPNDHGSVDDRRYTVGANADFGTAGLLNLQAGYRDRSNPYLIGFSPIIPLADQQSEISSKTSDFNARYTLPFEAYGYRHSVEIGADLLSADYTRQENGQYVLDSSTRRQGDVDSRGFYAAAKLSAPEGLTFTGGLRLNRFTTSVSDARYARAGCQTVFDTVFVEIIPPGGIFVPIQVPRQTGCTDAYRVQGQQGGTWSNRGAEIGVTWQPNALLTNFASVTLNFRNPNVDELLLAANDLRPQSGRTFEVGTRYSVDSRAEISLAAFYMRIDDEIYFGLDPRTGFGVNRNFDEPTERIGGELEARWRATDAISLRANLGYVSARFLGTGANVPLVPQVNANAELQWNFTPWARWLLSARYAGKRYDGNDFTNKLYPQLPAYTVVDTALRFAYRDAQLTAGIKNLLNETYSTIAYSNTFYPMPERSYYVQLQASF